MAVIVPLKGWISFVIRRVQNRIHCNRSEREKYISSQQWRWAIDIDTFLDMLVTQLFIHKYMLLLQIDSKAKYKCTR